MLQLVHYPKDSGLNSTRVSWQVRTVPPMLQLVQSPNASDLYSTRIIPAATTPKLQLVQSPYPSGPYSTRVLPAGPKCIANAPAVQSPNAWGLYSTRVFLEGVNCAADAEACAVASGIEFSLDSCSTVRRELYRRCCSWFSSDSTHDVPSSTIP